MRSEWVKYKIKEFSNVVGGGTPSTKYDQYYGGDVPWLTPKDMSIHKSKYIINGSRNITEQGLSKSSAKLVPAGTVLFTSRAPIGYIAIAKKEVSTNQGFKSLICNESLAHNEFVYYLLKHKTPSIEAIASGSTFKEVSGGVLKDFIVELPSLKTQKKIAHILSTLDDKIELNRKMNQSLEEMIQALFKSWFVDFDPVHAKANASSDADFDRIAKELGISREILDLFPDEFEESELGMIPKEWRVVGFKDLVKKYIDNRGKTPPIEDEGIPLLEVRSFPSDILLKGHKTDKFVSEKTYATWFRSHLESDDILISTVGTIGLTCIVPKGSRFTIAQNVLGIRANEEILLKKYMYYMMKNKSFINEINARLITTVQSSIKRKDMETIISVIPPLDIQDKFVQIIQPMMSYMQSNQNNDLKKTRDTLLPKLLSGELDVSELELDHVTH